MAKIAILGYGTVGSGVYKVIDKNRSVVTKNAGEDIEVIKILDLRDFPNDPAEDLITHDIEDVINDSTVDVVVETMGGTKPAYDFVKRALLAGKSVCTSNKALVADHGTELIQIAKKNNINFLFEASVGGGIPILRPMTECLIADEILAINGILNGTTNYILTKMSEDGSDFDDVLKEAQELGYAEADPTADVEGYDACRKIAILTALAYGAQLDYEDVYTEGISKITVEDFEYAKVMGGAIKILGSSKKIDGKLYAMVAPQIVSKDNPLYSVNGVFNAIQVTGNMLDDVMFYGQGAGKEATASAVVTDIIQAVRHKDNIPVIWDEKKQVVESVEDMENVFFVRTGDDKENIATYFGDVRYIDAGVQGEVGFITEPMKEKDFSDKYQNLTKPITRIRIADKL